MGRGFLAGIFWGGLIGLFLIVFSNQVMDRRVLSFPQPDAAPVEVPAGTEFDQARPETDPVVPEVETRPMADVATGVQAPEDTGETPPSFDTSSLEVPTPEVESPNTLGNAPEPADDPAISVTGPDTSAGGETPALTTPEAPTIAPDAATAAPDAVETPEVADEPEVAAPAPDAATTVDETATADTPADDAATDQTPEVDVADAVPKPPSPSIAPEAAIAPEIGGSDSGVSLPGADDDQVAILRPDGNDTQFFQPVDELTDRAPEVQTNRLPRVGLDAGNSAAEPEEAVAEEDEASDEPRTSTLPTIRRLGQEQSEEEAIAEAEAAPADDMAVGNDALSQWRMAFDDPGDQPLVSIVLVHDAGGASMSDVLRATPPTVAIAIRAGDSDARSVAQGYRDAGREVVLIPSLPEDAAPQDVEVALQANFDTIPEAVAVMDSTGESFQADRDAVAQVVDVIADTGHGLITFPRGLNTALQRAERGGVPAGLVFRDIDGTGQTSEQIQRALDRAAFRARPDAAVILVGRTGGATIAALTEWSLGSRAQTVTLAPISMALDGG